MILSILYDVFVNIDLDLLQTLNFDSFEIILLFVSVLLVNYLIGDGKSHWLEGVLLMMMYLIIALAAWYVSHPLYFISNSPRTIANLHY